MRGFVGLAADQRFSAPARVLPLGLAELRDFGRPPQELASLEWKKANSNVPPIAHVCGLSAVLFHGSRCAGAVPAVLEAVALAVHLQDVRVVGDAIQQRAGEPF